MIYISKAKRQRWCHVCHNSIEPDEHHLIVGKELGGYNNICSHCMKDLSKKIDKANNAVVGGKK